MASDRTRRFAVAGTVLGGLLAGGNVDRMVVQMPAWRRLGRPEQWGAYSREADLSRNGRILYPLEAIGGAVLSLAAAVGFWLDGGKPRRAAAPLAAAAILTLGGMLATTRAAPVMLGVRNRDHDSAALGKAFRSFHEWSAIRAVFQVLAFGANLWSVVTLGKTR